MSPLLRKIVWDEVSIHAPHPWFDGELGTCCRMIDRAYPFGHVGVQPSRCRKIFLERIGVLTEIVQAAGKISSFRRLKRVGG